MKNLQKVLVFVTVLALALGLVLGLVSCNNNGVPDTTDPTTAPTTAPTTKPTEPPLTADQVFGYVRSAMIDNEATRLKMEIRYGLEVTEGEGESAVSTSISCELMLDTMFYRQPFGSYVMMDMAVCVGEIPYVDYTMKVYMVEEKKSVVTYMQLLDNWTRTDSGMSVNDFLASAQAPSVSTDDIWSKDTALSDMTLEKGTLNGKEVYLLRGNAAAKSMASALENLGISDLSAYDQLTLPVTYYVDPETFLVLQGEVSVSALADRLSKDLAASLGASTENATLKLDVPDISYVLEYDRPPIPAVPQAAYDATGGSKGSDVPLILNRRGDAYIVTCPKEMIGEYISDSNVSIATEDHNLVGDYYFYTDFSDDEAKNLIKAKVDSLTGENLFVSQSEGPAIDRYTTWQITGNGQNCFYAWRENGDGWLLVVIYDYAGTGNAAELLPQFIGYLSPYGK